MHNHPLLGYAIIRYVIALVIAAGLWMLFDIKGLLLLLLIWLIIDEVTIIVDTSKQELQSELNRRFDDRNRAKG